MEPAHAASARRQPLQHAALGRSTGGGASNGRGAAALAPNSPKLTRGPALKTTAGARKGTAAARSAEMGSGSVLQKALSSDEFVKRKRTAGVSENVHNGPSKPSSRPMSRNHSSSSATSSTGSISTVQKSRPIYSQPRASRSQTSLSSRQRSRSRTRSSRPSPVLAAAILPALPARTTSSSSCPEPRGATLSATPTTSEPVIVDVQAEGELELRGGNGAAEVLVELRDGRSVPNSEYGDSDAEPFTDSEPTLVHPYPSSMPLPDLPSPQAPPSESTSPHSQSHRRPSTSRHRSSPSAISTSLANTGSKKDVRRYSSNSAMSTSPRSLPPPSSSPRGPTSRGRPLASTSPSPRAASRSVVVEKRMRRCSAEVETTPVRPPLHSYTSFDTFGLEAPPSPTGSPKVPESQSQSQSKGWWRS